MAMAKAPRLQSSDLVQSVQRACRLLQAFRNENEVLRLRELVLRTGTHKATASRLLRTLVGEGLVERVGDERFRSRIRVPAQRRYRIGFATRGADTPFSRAVSGSVERAAEEAGIDLITVNSHRSPRQALRNAETLIRERVDLVIEFQTHERIAPLIASRFVEVGIPVIAIEIPHPGAIFFGANNYQAGVLGGRAIARWVKQAWSGEVQSILLVEEDAAGPLVKLRVSGMLSGFRETLPGLEHVHTLEIDGRGSHEYTMDRIRRHIRQAPRRRTTVFAGNDPMALGAIRAFEECGRAETCAVMGQNASLEARREMRRPGTRLVGSVAYFPERYGDQAIRLAAAVLARQPVPPAVFTKHELVTPENVDRLYPLDEVLPEELAGSMVL
jgi:ribose transport system substrate-binding protein